MTKIKVTDYLIKQLNSLGIEEIFGLPGDYNFDIVEALERNKNVNWIGSTNELNAGYAADGYARIKGYSAMVSTYGVGELSAINAIAGAMAENIPIIKIVGIPSTKHIENKTLLHHNLTNADYRAFERAYSNVVETTAFLNKENAKKEIDRLINTIVKTKKPVYLAIPMDICSIEIEDDFKLKEISSDKNNLKIAADLIIDEIKKSKNPIVLADILTRRFNAINEINNFIEKTSIPSCSFLRGMDIIENDKKNYLGVYVGNLDNKICYDNLNSSDCIIASGTVISDLNTMGFSIKFDLKNHINIQPYYTEIKGRKIENVLMKDILKELTAKINYKSELNLKRTLVYNPSELKEEKPLSSDYIYPRLNEFLKENDIFITEVGLVPFGAIPMNLAKNITIQNQILWGSIGWATPCAEGCAMADKTRRTILVTGDGAHQLTAQEISTMMRNNLKPIIFVINNSGYTVERILCDDVNYKYNDIASWNYEMLPKMFKGDCFCASASTNKEFDEILKAVEKEQKEKLCYIELKTDFLDIPYLSLGIAKNPQRFKK